MIDASFNVVEVGKTNSERIYSDLEELSEDFPLTDEELQELYEGRDVKKSWAKRKWIISISEPEDE